MLLQIAYLYEAPARSKGQGPGPSRAFGWEISYFFQYASISSSVLPVVSGMYFHMMYR
jgi:hypothetical protein